MAALNERQSSGLRSPAAPPEGADAYGVFSHYLRFYVDDFARTRSVAKARARNALIATTTLAGVIAVVGNLSSATDWVGFPIISTGLSGAIAVITAWDGFFRHRELWLQRSRIVGALNELQRNSAGRIARGDTPDEVAVEGLSRLDELLEGDQGTWAALHSPTRQHVAVEGLSVQHPPEVS